MSGEDSKKSGEIGERLSAALLNFIGWQNRLHNISIDCNTKSHKNDAGNPRQTHGEDQIFLYNNPFHDDQTDVIHISVKNNMKNYPGTGSLRTKFKGYINELEQTIDCAKYSPKLRDMSDTFRAKKKIQHAGLLIWLQNDNEGIEKSILGELAPSRLDFSSDMPFYVIDNGRAGFLLKVGDDLRRRARGGGSYEFFYPRIGTSMSVDENRLGNWLPLELIASDVIPSVVTKDGKSTFLLYTSESFDSEAYKRLIAYALSFASGLVQDILIGMPDYNPVQHAEQAERARLAFHNRDESIGPFSYNRSILGFLDGDNA